MKNDRKIRRYPLNQYLLPIVFIISGCASPKAFDTPEERAMYCATAKRYAEHRLSCQNEQWTDLPKIDLWAWEIYRA